MTRKELIARLQEFGDDDTEVKIFNPDYGDQDLNAMDVDFDEDENYITIGY